MRTEQAPTRLSRAAVWLRTRPGPRRVLNGVTVLLIAAGLTVFSWPFATNLYADWKQSGLTDELGSTANQQAYRNRTLADGDPLTRLIIPSLGVDTVVVAGTSISALKAGSGHYRKTALPCEPGNAAIAGHRTTYSKPFARINELKPGDRIILETPVGRCSYRVHDDPWITVPSDVTALRPSRGSWLTLTTCHPPGSARERLVVKAKLERSEPAYA